MFFKLHSEGKIGYKKMSDADLGLGTSHQTHIGLYGDIFTFLHNREVEEEAMFIYNDTVDFIDCYFDRIEMPNGDFRSPKIRKGGSSISVTTIIRDNAKLNPSYNWFLIWFGLENEQMVFYLFNNHSKDFQELQNIIDLSKNGGRVSKGEVGFDKLLIYLENKVNENGKSIIEDLEIASQIGSSKKYRPFDLERASELFKNTGKRGEELIAQFLDKQKHKNQIFNYTWYNQSRETGLPYDFSIQYNNQNIVFLDVKSTGHAFERPIIFSNKEIECIVDKPYYHIYRVFDLSDEKVPKLKICENSKDLAKMIVSETEIFQKSLKEIQTELKEAKFSIDVSHNLLSFGSEISLNI